MLRGLAGLHALSSVLLSPQPGVFLPEVGSAGRSCNTVQNFSRLICISCFLSALPGKETIKEREPLGASMAPHEQ